MTRRELLRNAAQLAGLWGLAIAQPLFEVTKTGEVYVAAGWRGSDLVVFALVVAFAPPVAMTAAEALADQVRRGLGPVLHLLFVAGVGAIFVAYAVKHGTQWSSKVAVAVILLAAVAIVYVFQRFEAFRAFVTVLSPASILFVGLFLFASPVKHLVLPAAGADLSGPRSSTPVVVIVFDEFPTLSLLDARGELDSRSYPAFAQLARDGTWFRNAISVADFTRAAVPVILTGRVLDGSRPPSVASYPDNLLSLFARRGGVVSREEVTRLCPGDACPDNRPDTFPRRVVRNLPVLGKLSLATFLPDALYSHLPATRLHRMGEHHDDGLRRVASTAGEPGVLHYVHTSLPHQPWSFLPSGRRYGPVAPNLRDLLPSLPAIPLNVGVASFPSLRWTRDRTQLAHALQLHLAQVRFSDRLLARTLDRLRASGAYDRALIVVTADHGIAFQPGLDARRVERATSAAILSVPFFVKLPHQRRGGVSQRFVQTDDVAPTVAAALGTRLPWQADGRSALDRTPSDRARVEVHAIETHRTLVVDPAGLARTLRQLAKRQAALFFGSDPDRIYRPKPGGALVGRPVREFQPAKPTSLRYAIDGGRHALEFNPRSPLAPGLIAGTLSGAGAGGRQLAIALNGTIAATPMAHRSGPRLRFEALVAERDLRPGRNRVDIFAITPTPAGTRLAPIASAAP